LISRPQRYPVYTQITPQVTLEKTLIYTTAQMRVVGGNNVTGETPRVVQEYVPGKQVTLSHLISNPKQELCEKLGLTGSSAIGILTITPCEAAIVAADIATKAAAVQIGFMDRFTGSLVLVGTVSAVEVALRQVTSFLSESLGFSISKLTRS